MKLYTEEQVKTFRKWQREWDFYDKDSKRTPKPLTFDEYLDSLTPIELPSDDDMTKQAGSIYGRNYPYFEDYEEGFYDGAEWIKEQILNQTYNKEVTALENQS